MYARNMNGQLTATWVFCAKCGSGHVGDPELRTCPGCREKQRVKPFDALDMWDWLTVSLIPLFCTLFMSLNSTFY